MEAAELKNHDQAFTLSESTRKIVFILALILCLFPIMSPPTALLLGLILAQLIENPFSHLNHKAINWLLKISVVGLGFGMNIFSAIQAGREGVLFTVASIITVLAV